MKKQQKFSLEEEVSVSLKEPAAFLNTSRQFPKQKIKLSSFKLYTL